MLDSKKNMTKTRLMVVSLFNCIPNKARRRVIGTFNRVKSALSRVHKAQPGVSRIIEMLVISYLVFVSVRIVRALGGALADDMKCVLPFILAAVAGMSLIDDPSIDFMGNFQARSILRTLDFKYISKFP